MPTPNQIFRSAALGIEAAMMHIVEIAMLGKVP
jgi:hypothetical protein